MRITIATLCGINREFDRIGHLPTIVEYVPKSLLCEKEASALVRCLLSDLSPPDLAAVLARRQHADVDRDLSRHHANDRFRLRFGPPCISTRIADGVWWFRELWGCDTPLRSLVLG